MCFDFMHCGAQEHASAEAKVYFDLMYGLDIHFIPTWQFSSTEFFLMRQVMRQKPKAFLIMLALCMSRQ